MPGETGEPVVTMLVWFYFFPREAAGASSTRHSPRPHLSLGETFLHHSGVDASRESEGMSLYDVTIMGPRVRFEWVSRRHSNDGAKPNASAV
jgi:hypothetical protein